MPLEVGMEFYENGNAPENNNDDDKNKTVNPDINRDGGVFAEKDYGEEAAKNAAVQPNYYQPYQQAVTGAAPAADNAYRQMYSGGNSAPGYGYPAGGQQQNSGAQYAQLPEYGYAYTWLCIQDCG